MRLSFSGQDSGFSSRQQGFDSPKPYQFKLNKILNLYGRIAQLGEHLPYKQGVIGSSPIATTIYGGVAQLVRALACHARCREFESRHFRHLKFNIHFKVNVCRFSSSGRAADL